MSAATIDLIELVGPSLAVIVAFALWQAYLAWVDRRRWRRFAAAMHQVFLRQADALARTLERSR
jgi:hypothetical protein